MTLYCVQSPQSQLVPKSCCCCLSSSLLQQKQKRHCPAEQVQAVWAASWRPVAVVLWSPASLVVAAEDQDPLDDRHLQLWQFQAAVAVPALTMTRCPAKQVQPHLHGASHHFLSSHAPWLAVVNRHAQCIGLAKLA